MKVLIDFREKDLWNLLSTTELKFKENKDIILKQESLDLGDVQIFVDNKLVSIIERKTMSDLASSIKDGRYREQKSRLKNLNINNHNKLYLFEGQVFGEDCLSPKNSKFCNVNGMAFNILLSGIVNTYIRDNLSIYRTKNLNESVRFLAKLIDKTYEHKDEIIKTSQFVETPDSNESQETCDAEYLSTLKLKKKINLTGKDCYIAQLAQITGVSINIGQAIAANFPSLIDLSVAYIGLDDDIDRSNLLCDIKIKIGKNKDKERELGKVISNKIYQNIFGLE